jgi:hypothetical protein
MWHTLCLVVLATSLSGNAHIAFAQSAEVTLELARDASLVVAHYRLSSPVTTLRFPGNGRVRVKTWKVDEGSLTDAGNAIAFPKPTRDFAVTLGAFARDGEIDRVYTPVIHFGDRLAAEVYSEYLLPKASGVVRLAGGGIAFGKVVHPTSIAWRANDPATYLLVGAGTLESRQRFELTMDRSSPAWVEAEIGRVAANVMAQYTGRFSAAPNPRPWIVVTFNGAAPGSSYRGDTSPGIVRLNLMGSDWQEPTAERAGRRRHLAAHELFHLWNGHRWFPASGSETWMLEGGADAAADEALLATCKAKIRSTRA